MCLQIKHSFHTVHFFHLTLNAPITAAFLQSKRLDKSAEWISPRKYPLTVTFCGSLSVNAHAARGDCPAHVFETPISWRVCVHDAQVSAAAAAAVDLGQDKLKGRSHNQRRPAWNSAARVDTKNAHTRPSADEKRGKRMRAERVQNTLAKGWAGRRMLKIKLGIPLCPRRSYYGFVKNAAARPVSRSDRVTHIRSGRSFATHET